MFKRILFKVEESQFHSMLALINDVYVLEYGMDGRVWTRFRGGKFSVVSFFVAIKGNMLAPSPFSCMWKVKTPKRVVAFVCMVLTMNNL